MKFVSTNSQSLPVDLSEAVNHCVAVDGGIYTPQTIPVIPKAFFNNIGEMTLCEIAYVVASTFLGRDIPATELKSIVDETFAFEAPLIDVGGVHVLELFHGPTLTFKDYGARFMARVMRAIDSSRTSRRRTVLVATTGNTGAAAANGLSGVKGIDVLVLYPHGSLSRMQRASLGNAGTNIRPVEVLGTIEDCKRLIQEAFADSSLADYNLTGANSINIARLIPQIAFAFHAYATMKSRNVPKCDKAAYFIPCGNASNLVAAAMAKRCGLPVGHLYAATNDNNGVAPLLQDSAPVLPRVPKSTIAPGMDMSYPSGWPRLLKLYENDLSALRRDITATEPVSDARIAETINMLLQRYSYLIDPHGAVAYYSAISTELNSDIPKVVFATGHPAKQLDTMTRVTGTALELPVQMTRFMHSSKHHAKIPPTLPALKKILIETNINL